MSASVNPIPLSELEDIFGESCLAPLDTGADGAPALGVPPPSRPPKEDDADERAWKAAQSARCGFRPFDVAAMLSGPPPVLDFVIPGLLAATVGALYSKGASGKSQFMLQLAMSIASGHDCFDGLFGQEGWHAVRRPERVLYVCLEDPEVVVRKRVCSVLSALEARGKPLTEAERARLAANLTVFGPGDAPTDLGDEAWADRLAHCAAGRDEAAERDDFMARRGAFRRGVPHEPIRGRAAPRLVILDTLSRVVGGLDENKAGDMARLVSVLERAAREGGGGILYAHHTNKASALSGAATAQAARGSGVLTDNARAAFSIGSLTEDDAQNLPPALSDGRLLSSPGADGQPLWRGLVRLSATKINYCRPPDDVILERLPGGVLAYVRLRAAAPTTPHEKKTKEATGGEKVVIRGKEIHIPDKW